MDELAEHQNATQMRTARSMLLLIGLAILATLPGWLPGRVYVPRGDTHLKQRVEHSADAIRHGRAPLWTPAIGLGEPLLERGQIGALSPTFLPHLIRNPKWSWTISAAVRAAMAGLGISTLARRYSLREVDALLAGALFMLSVGCVAQLYEPTMNFAAWLPWLILALHRICERDTWARVMVAALLFAAVFLLGDLYSSACALAVCTGVVLIKRISRLPAMLLAAGVGFALAGAQWVPLIDNTIKHGWRTALSVNTVDAVKSVAVVVLMITILLVAKIFRGSFSFALVAALLVTSIATNRGVSLAEFHEAVNASAPQGFPDLPQAWIVPKPEWFRSRSLATARVAEVGFDPTKSVPIDDEVPIDTLDWLNRAVPDRHGKSADGARNYFGPPMKIESITQVGNRVVIRTTTGGTAWIVVSGAYADGWTASSKPIGKLITVAPTRDRIVLPAYGKLRVTPITETVAAEVVMEYRPASFRRGLLVSAAGGVLLLLLGGVALTTQRI